MPVDNSTSKRDSKDDNGLNHIVAVWVPFCVTGLMSVQPASFKQDVENLHIRLVYTYHYCGCTFAYGVQLLCNQKILHNSIRLPG